MSFVRRHISNFTRQSLLKNYNIIFRTSSSKKVKFFSGIKFITILVVSTFTTFVIVVTVSSALQVFFIEYLHADFLITYVLSGNPKHEFIKKLVTMDFVEASAAIGHAICHSEPFEMIISYKHLLIKGIIFISVASLAWCFRTYIVSKIHNDTMEVIQKSPAVLNEKPRLYEELLELKRPQVVEAIKAFFIAKGRRIPENFELRYSKLITERVTNEFGASVMAEAEAFFASIFKHVHKCNVVYGARAVLSPAFATLPPTVNEVCYKAVDAINAQIEAYFASLSGLEFLFWKLEVAITGSLKIYSNFASNPEQVDYALIRNMIEIIIFLTTGMFAVTSMHVASNLIHNTIPIVDLSGKRGGLSTALAHTSTYVNYATELTYTTAHRWYITGVSCILKPFSGFQNIHDYLQTFDSMTNTNKVISPSGQDLTHLAKVLKQDSTLISKSYNEIVETLVNEKNTSISTKSIRK